MFFFLLSVGLKDSATKNIHKEVKIIWKMFSLNVLLGTYSYFVSKFYPIEDGIILASSVLWYLYLKNFCDNYENFMWFFIVYYYYWSESSQHNYLKW